MGLFFGRKREAEVAPRSLVAEEGPSLFLVSSSWFVEVIRAAHGRDAVFLFGRCSGPRFHLLVVSLPLCRRFLLLPWPHVSSLIVVPAAPCVFLPLIPLESLCIVLRCFLRRHRLVFNKDMFWLLLPVCFPIHRLPTVRFSLPFSATGFPLVLCCSCNPVQYIRKTCLPFGCLLPSSRSPPVFACVASPGLLAIPFCSDF